MMTTIIAAAIGMEVTVAETLVLKNKKKYCKKCKCLDPNFKAPTAACKGFCKSPSYKGDGFCDDGNNNCGCKYDGGDCCGKSGKKGQYLYCSKCACLDPKLAAKPMDTSGCTGTCSAGGQYKGDGYCDDGNNNCGCEYDGGDCCGKSGKSVQYRYCKDCACKDPKKTSKPVSVCSGTCAAGGSYKGDGYCDDTNNNCGCEYDGGDCCGKSTQKSQYGYCKDCVCKEPKRAGKPQKGLSCTGKCAAGGSYKGDGYCDDANNNCGCEYDGGDCCGKNSNKKYCTDCKCLDPVKGLMMPPIDFGL